MNASQRKERISEITHGNVLAADGKDGKRLRYRGEVKTFEIFEIPIECLVYNIENGRIASLVKSFEKEHGSLNPEKEEDAFLIAQFLYDSNDVANKKTKKDLAKNGQLEPGIITKDGVLVDGNRRASLMLSILKDESFSNDERNRCRTFRTVVLPEDADDKEILRLETSFQMGADEKVGYNPIEKYLHARDMKEKGFTISEIEEYMGLKNQSEVHTLLEIVSLIDDYLDYYEYTGIYTRLPKGFEDDLLKLNTALKKIKRGDISWIQTNKIAEVTNDLKCICFDFIRLNVKSDVGFDFRAIMATKGSNFLANEMVWDKFVESWHSATDDVEEEDIDSVLERSSSPSDSDRLLNQRDKKWRDKVQESLMDGFNEAKNIIDNKKEKDKPSVLLRKALNAMSEIDPNVVRASRDRNNLADQLSQIENICYQLRTYLS